MTRTAALSMAAAKTGEQSLWNEMVESTVWKLSLGRHVQSQALVDVFIVYSYRHFSTVRLGLTYCITAVIYSFNHHRKD